jgi:hypothetical protein
MSAVERLTSIGARSTCATASPLQLATTTREDQRTNFRTSHPTGYDRQATIEEVPPGTRTKKAPSGPSQSVCVYAIGDETVIGRFMKFPEGWGKT